MSTSLTKQVSHSLKQPLHKGLPRLEARHYIPLYQEEPSHDEWWKKIDVSRKFPFARDKIVELFFWILGIYFELKFAMVKNILTKIGNELATKERSHLLVYAKEVMKKLVKAYFHEAKWFHTNYVPTLEEDMSLQLITTGYGMLATTSLVGMIDVVTEHALEWSVGDCKISAVELLMKYHGASKQEAGEELQKGVIDAWKDINEEFLRPTAIPMPILTQMLNFSRVMDVLYSDGDNYTHFETKLKDYVTLLFVSPLPM
ncbi:hypothetical protein EUGRSUZ_F03402 [Eucalyptus grandis]|uniref:Terpene synthase metal-binding domain-containing protein n=2 Tax=Eucalyptus grandis TaxID=71139 RepID=A0A059BVF3_EUCGR|nr:hypothetical protein EUGRSUZ_F03402 [Eucalyptus grandis]